MWYAIQVAAGQEQQTIFFSRALIGKEYLQDFFCPEVEYRKRWGGQWHTLNRPMFPGYVFAVTHQIEELYLALRQVPKLTKILGTGKTPVALSQEETAWIEMLLNRERVADMSVGVLEGERLRVCSGALKGKEGLVTHINRHKRLARVEVELMGRTVQVELGLEVTERM